MSRQNCAMPECGQAFTPGVSGGRGMCSKHYTRWRRYGDPSITYRPGVTGPRPRGTAEERFWAKVARRGDDECWLWLAGVDKDGYGKFRTGGSGSPNVMAHRYSWELANDRAVPDGLVIDHLCRTHACVNPSHLSPATNRVNIVVRGMGPAALNHRKTQCDNGHKFTPENTYTSPKGHRYCRTCFRDVYPSRQERRRAS